VHKVVAFLALAAVCNAGEQDPWVAADELCAKGDFDAAARIAKDDPALAKQVERLRAAPAPPELYARLRRLKALTDADDWKAAAALAPARFEKPRNLPELRLLSRHAIALFRTAPKRAEAPLRTALAACDEAGWKERAAVLARLLLGVVQRTDEILPLAKRVIREARERNDDVQLGIALLTLGNHLGLAGAHDDALEALQAAAEAHRRAKYARGEASALASIGTVLFQTRRYDRAIPVLRRAAELAEDPGTLHGALRLLAYAHFVRDDTAKAAAVCKEALAKLERNRSEFLSILASCHGTDWRAAAETYAELEEAARADGNIVREFDAYSIGAMALRQLGELAKANEKILVALKKLPHLPPAQRVVKGGNLGSVLLDLGRPTEAVPLLEAAAAHAETTGNKGQGTILYHLLSEALRSLGRPDAAIAAARKSLALDPENPTGYLVLATALSATGRFADAVKSNETALALAKKRGTPRLVAQALNNLAGVRDEAGDTEAALELYERALALRREQGNAKPVAIALTNLGTVYTGLGRVDEAIAAHREAAAIFAERGWAALESSARNTLGLAYRKTGRIDDAAASFRAAIRIAGDRAESRVRPLVNLAQLEWDRGNEEEGAALADEALAIARDLARPELLGSAEAAAARIRVLAGRPAEAIPLLRSVVDRTARRYDRLGEEHAARARAEHWSRFVLGVEAAVRADRPEDALFFLESVRARALLLALGGRERLRRAVVPAELRDAEARAVVRLRRAREAHRKARETGVRRELKHWRAETAAAEAELAGAVARIQREARLSADLYCPKPARIEHLRAWLRPHEALVMLGEGDDRIHALVITRAGARVVRGARELDVDAVSRDAFPGPLQQAILEPLRLEAGVRRVIVAPNAALAAHPWCLAFEGRAVAYVPSATTFGLLREQAGRRGEGVLAFGDPRHEAGALGGAGLGPLPESAAEARDVGTDVCVGADATEEALRERLSRDRRWRAVHLACHGVVNTARPLFSGLALTPGGGHDGVVTVRDVLALSLRADLVALSACDTGLGRTYRGEGLLGFTRAFLFAGAPRVIVSLWKVDDAATRALMARFHELWNDRPAAEALREAQAFVRAGGGPGGPERGAKAATPTGENRWKHPRYWAAWQLWGLPD